MRWTVFHECSNSYGGGRGIFERPVLLKIINRSKETLNQKNNYDGSDHTGLFSSSAELCLRNILVNFPRSMILNRWMQVYVTQIRWVWRHYQTIDRLMYTPDTGWRNRVVLGCHAQWQHAFRSTMYAPVRSAHANYLSTFPVVHGQELAAPGHVTEYLYDVTSLSSD